MSRPAAVPPLPHPVPAAPVYRAPGLLLEQADALQCYAHWPTPTAIIADGPYGVSGYPGDPATPRGLAAAYRPHVEAWTRYSTPRTTLWFWNTEVGWATVHPLLEANGWEYRNTHVWDKGLAHVAGNTNGQTMRKVPVVTEVCVQYTRRAEFVVRGPSDPGVPVLSSRAVDAPGGVAEHTLDMQAWLRYEWRRSGLPLSATNAACGVRNAASRKYFTADHLWYYPPPEAFAQLAAYANAHGRPEGRPYFSVDARRSLSAAEWAERRSVFHFEQGVTNVWQHPAVRGAERIKVGTRALHTNQKPLALIERCVRLSTDPGDVVWEPFGGLCTAVVAARRLGRVARAAEITPAVYRAAVTRLSAPA